MLSHGLKHIWCSGEHLQLQGDVCGIDLDHAAVPEFIVMKTNVTKSNSLAQ